MVDFMYLGGLADDDGVCELLQKLLQKLTNTEFVGVYRDSGGECD